MRDGLAERAASGLFVGHTPYGYKNMRIDGPSLVIIDPDAAPKVRLAFQLYAFEHYTLDSLVEKMSRGGVAYTLVSHTWPRSKLHTILRDRSCLGGLRYRGQWMPGKHEPLVDRVTWGRVQAKLGEKQYKSHELTFAGELIGCGHCGAPITGEAILEKSTGKQDVYYRCSKDTPLEMRLAGEIDAETHGRKGVELCGRIATLSTQLKVTNVNASRMAETAAKVFEPAQGRYSNGLMRSMRNGVRFSIRCV